MGRGGMGGAGRGGEGRERWRTRTLTRRLTRRDTAVRGSARAYPNERTDRTRCMVHRHSHTCSRRDTRPSSVASAAQSSRSMPSAQYLVARVRRTQARTEHQTTAASIFSAGRERFCEAMFCARLRHSECARSMRTFRRGDVSALEACVAKQDELAHEMVCAAEDQRNLDRS